MCIHQQRFDHGLEISHNAKVSFKPDKLPVSAWSGLVYPKAPAYFRCRPRCNAIHPPWRVCCQRTLRTTDWQARDTFWTGGTNTQTRECYDFDWQFLKFYSTTELRIVSSNAFKAESSNPQLAVCLNRHRHTWFKAAFMCHWSWDQRMWSDAVSRRVNCLFTACLTPNVFVTALRIST